MDDEQDRRLTRRDLIMLVLGAILALMGTLIADTIQHRREIQLLQMEATSEVQRLVTQEAKQLAREDLRRALNWASEGRKDNLRGINVAGGNLSLIDLAGADLERANLQGCGLRYANLQRANLMVANLQGADLVGANLQEANLSAARLKDADLRDADLQGANLVGAKLQGVRANQRTIWPDGFEVPEEVVMED